ncbi:MAG: FAD-binding domain-containing protein [Patescibacteria group bacterium]
MKEINIFWNRSDHRLLDNPALFYSTKDSIERGVEHLSIFIIDPHFLDNPLYARRLKFLIKILKEFSKTIKIDIIIDNPKNYFEQLAKQYQINVFVNADFEPYGRKRDLELSESSKESGFKIMFFNDKISVDVNKRTGAGKIYSVFTPFKKSVIREFLEVKSLPNVELCAVKQISLQKSIDLDEVGKTIQDLSITVLDEVINLSELDAELEYDWYTSEAEAIKTLNNFLENNYSGYDQNRDVLSKQNSQLSIALKWGLISSRIIKDSILKFDKNALESTFISELIWREFYKYLLYHYPLLLNQEFQSKFRFNNNLWVSKEDQLNRFKDWIHSRTGYPIVDAAMSQITKEGFMHNRARMIVGSILTKNLGVDWRLGQEYFRAMLLDLDEASNNGGWQWSASVGADPKPIRIFNPYIQDEKFDPDNLYKEKYLKLKEYNLNPIIEHARARDEAKVRYQKKIDT